VLYGTVLPRQLTLILCDSVYVSVIFMYLYHICNVVSAALWRNKHYLLLVFYIPVNKDYQ